jgi:4-amino-4-deoxy-L-arabinose transferase-like glycosyltransferase
LLPFSLFFIYLIGRRMGGEASGLLSVVLLGGNALILLHSRRAMAEGALTLGVLLALWSFLDGWKRPWLAGLGMALAFNAKQSTLALLPVGLLAVAWGLFIPATGQPGARARKALTNILIYGAIFTLVTFVLNPFLWRDPLAAAQVSMKERNDLLQRQVADTLRLAPEKALVTPGQRAVSLVANLFVLPPAFAEVKQYQAYTAAAEQVYLATPGHNLLRGMVGGGLMLAIFLLGIVLALVDYRHKNHGQRRVLALVWLATVSQTVMLIWAVPLTWQRYVIPLVPIVCLWVAYPATLLAKVKRILGRGSQNYASLEVEE